MTEPGAVMATMSALIDAGPDATESFLLAACYCQALREGDTPRNVVDALFKALPDSNAWPPLRDALLAVLGAEPEEEAGAPR